MIYNCKDCGVLWTSKNSTDKCDPKRAPFRQCVDCSDFDWPNWHKGIEKARSWLGDPNKKKASGAKSSR